MANKLRNIYVFIIVLMVILIPNVNAESVRKNLCTEFDYPDYVCDELFGENAINYVLVKGPGAGTIQFTNYNNELFKEKNTDGRFYFLGNPYTEHAVYRFIPDSDTYIESVTLKKEIVDTTTGIITYEDIELGSDFINNIQSQYGVDIPFGGLNESYILQINVSSLEGFSKISWNENEEDLIDGGNLEIVSVQDMDGTVIDAIRLMNNEGDNNSGHLYVSPNSILFMNFKPDYGYQIGKDFVNNYGITALDEKFAYRYTIPDNDIVFKNIFNKVDNSSMINSKIFELVSYTIADDEIENGTFLLELNDIEPTEDMINNFTKEAKEYNVKSYFDLQLKQVIYKDGTDQNVWSEKINSLKNNVKITLKFKNDMNSEDFMILHEKSEGNYKSLPVVYNKENNSITFETDGFSNYALALKESKEIEVSNPSTFDNINIYIITFLVSLVCLIFVLKKYKKMINN